MSIDAQEVIKHLAEAEAGTHPMRALRATFECGHHRLIPAIRAVMGIGSHGECRICTEVAGGVFCQRIVVNLEETGTLSEEYMRGERG